jgi:putative CocE/NonD family hydrolase
MRDGVALLTDIYAPVGKSLGTLLVRTPYGRTSLIASLTARSYATHGYHVVNQSCRGTFGSGGDFEPFSQEIDDGADAVAWLRTQDWFRGRFALCGASYLGYAAWAVMMDPPPELAAAVIAVSAHDNHWVAHGAGAFSLEQMLGLFDGFEHLEAGLVGGIVRGVTAGRRLRPGFEELPLVRAQETVLAGSRMPYREWLMAPDAEDPVWRPMRLGQALERVNVPVLLQEGWQDRFIDQMIDEYQRLRLRGVDVGLTIGPWTHVEAATRGLRILVQETLDWLAEHLAGTGRRRRPSPVRIFVTGAKEWRYLPEWPPAINERVFFLQPDGQLGDAHPTPTAGPSTFSYDPADPTPAVGGRVINPAIGGHRDNRKLEARDDVLTSRASRSVSHWR